MAFTRVYNYAFADDLVHVLSLVWKEGSSKRTGLLLALLTMTFPDMSTVMDSCVH